jgi:hypothetical protein
LDFASESMKNVSIASHSSARYRVSESIQARVAEKQRSGMFVHPAANRPSIENVPASITLSCRSAACLNV